MTVKTYPVTHSDAEWRKILTPEQYQVLRRHATERPGSCALLQEHRAVEAVVAVEEAPEPLPPIPLAKRRPGGARR